MRLTEIESPTLSFASLLARCAILIRWRDPATPPNDQLLSDIMSSINLEKIHCSVCTKDEGTIPEIFSVFSQNKGLLSCFSFFPSV